MSHAEVNSAVPILQTSGTADVQNVTSRLTDSQAATGWIFSPAYDAVFISNILWPVLLLLQFTPGFDGRSGVQFWQLYFITTPHRWITLLIVLLDRERFRQRQRAFLGLAAAVILTCLSIRITTGALTCLLAADYLWNAWHFAAQHHGIYRIYSRISSAKSILKVRLEKCLMRSFLLYVIFRTASSASSPGAIEPWLKSADWISLLIPAWLVLRDIRTFGAGVAGRSLYLVSAMSLYVSLLWAVHLRHPAMILSLATASAWFHASEYLAVITWHVQRRAVATRQQNPALRWVAARWRLGLLMFAVVLGSASWLMEREMLEIWLLFNVIAAFLHYAYDGMIWKSSRAR